MKDAPQRKPARYATGRMEAFSDGVFAIAITLLVLEISVPATAEDNLWNAVLHQWPSYLAYLVSFSTVGALWLGHAAITDYLRTADVWVLRLNLLVLFVVSFLPFPTRLLAESIGHEGAERIACTIYGCTLAVGLLLLHVLWQYALREQLVRTDASEEDVTVLTAKLTPGMAGYLVMILLGLFLPVAAVLGYLVIAVIYLVPFRTLRRRVHTATEPPRPAAS